MILASTGRRFVAMVAPMAVAAGVTVLGAGAAGAQDEMAAHPAHIHTGTCDQLGEVVYPLAAVGAPGMMGMPDATPGASEESMAADETPMAAGEMMGAEAAAMVEVSETTVDALLEDILAEEHAINVHESEENVGTYIACGEIGGTMMMGTMMGDALAVGLRELKGSGYTGIATLQAMDEQTLVTVYLAQDLAGGMMGEAGAEATPAS